MPQRGGNFPPLPGAWTRLPQAYRLDALRLWAHPDRAIRNQQNASPRAKRMMHRVRDRRPTVPSLSGA
jgi:hypothetical protein